MPLSLSNGSPEILKDSLRFEGAVWPKARLRGFVTHFHRNSEL